MTGNDNRFPCTDCGKHKPLSDYYMSSSPFHKHTGKLHVCKKCLWDYIGDETENIEKIQVLLRRIDRPYLTELWKSSLLESNKQGSNVFKTYMKNLGLQQYRELTWADNDIALSNTTDIEEVRQEEDLLENTVELRKIWGNYSQEDYTYLDNFYREYANTYATDTPVQINLYRNIAKVHLQAEKELSQGTIKQFKDLMELSSKLHNDGNIKPIQSTGANDDKGLSTYGLWIKTIEQDEPAEYFEKKPLYADFDKFKLTLKIGLFVLSKISLIFQKILM